MQSFDCPACGSDQTQRLALVYAHGISSVSTVSSGVGFAGGRVGVGAGTTTGTSQTAASLAAAPAAKRPWWPVVGTFFLLLLLDAFIPHRVASLLAFVGAGFLGYRTYTHNRAVPEALRRWQNAFQCLRCGNTWELGAATQAEVAPTS